VKLPCHVGYPLCRQAGKVMIGPFSSLAILTYYSLCTCVFHGTKRIVTTFYSTHTHAQTDVRTVPWETKSLRAQGTRTVFDWLVRSRRRTRRITVPTTMTGWIGRTIAGLPSGPGAADDGARGFHVPSLCSRRSAFFKRSVVFNPEHDGDYLNFRPGESTRTVQTGKKARRYTFGRVT